MLADMIQANHMLQALAPHAAVSLSVEVTSYRGGVECEYRAYVGVAPDAILVTADTLAQVLADAAARLTGIAPAYAAA